MPALPPSNGFTATQLDRRPTPVGELRPGAPLAADSPLAQIDPVQLARPTSVQILFNVGFKQYNGKWAIVGITKNEDTGVVIPSVPVDLYESVAKLYVSSTTSDANGVFAFVVGGPVKDYFLVGYLPGVPDIAGTTVNRIRAVGVP